MDEFYLIRQGNTSVNPLTTPFPGRKVEDFRPRSVWTDLGNEEIVRLITDGTDGSSVKMNICAVASAQRNFHALIITSGSD